jgi:endonuclease/exonuclease/phosphatase family metal-dependent hydrolase
VRNLWFLIFLSLSLFGGTSLKIASYNVENLFDLKYDGTEYSEYIPNTIWKWNATNYRKKLINLSKVIKDMDPDIIALQEIESDIALKDLQSMLTRQGLYFKYRAIADKKNTSVKVAILSRFPLQKRELEISKSRAYRNILEAKVIIEGKALYIFSNHWKSKSGPESKRIQYAKTLKKRLDQLPQGSEYILAGDFNAHYEEHKLFLKRRKHNDTKGVTGINHILKTVDDKGKLHTQENVSRDESYNLWMELPSEQRWTHTYRGQKEALDHIIISPALADSKNSHYVEGSFKTFSPEYLMHKNKPYRWQRSRTRPLHHIGKGYSDHLPIVAEFYIQ